jgi:hypothetical protein
MIQDINCINKIIEQASKNVFNLNVYNTRGRNSIEDEYLNNVLINDSKIRKREIIEDINNIFVLKEKIKVDKDECYKPFYDLSKEDGKDICEKMMNEGFIERWYDKRIECLTKLGIIYTEYLKQK